VSAVVKVSTRYALGRNLCILASLFPIGVGTFYYISGLPEIYTAMVGNLSADEISYKTLYHVTFANLIMTGLTLFLVSFFGLKSKSKLSWWICLLGTIWVGGNDVFATAIAYLRADEMFPIPIFPLTLGLIGTALTSKELFSNPRG
jgi:hypothetical protein